MDLRAVDEHLRAVDEHLPGPVPDQLHFLTVLS